MKHLTISNLLQVMRELGDSETAETIESIINDMVLLAAQRVKALVPGDYSIGTCGLIDPQPFDRERPEFGCDFQEGEGDWPTAFLPFDTTEENTVRLVPEHMAGSAGGGYCIRGLGDCILVCRTRKPLEAYAQYMAACYPEDGEVDVERLEEAGHE